MCWRYAAILLAAVVLGCGGGSGMNLAPVTGTVTYRGQPLAQGTVTFFPTTGRPATGKIENGKIVQVTSLAPNDGATVGPNQVTIESTEKTADMYTPAKSLIPARYGVISESGLKADIQPGKKNEFSFTLTD